ncbi:MAG: hypothetical protein LC777_21705 [Actinobacteria bacterium]|nr:hypothetical protein [Actinomycetota bacterium]
MPASTVVGERAVRLVLGCHLQWPAAQLLGNEHLRNRPRAIWLAPREKPMRHAISVFGLHLSCQSLCISVFHARKLRSPHTSDNVPARA